MFREYIGYFGRGHQFLEYTILRVRPCRAELRVLMMHANLLNFNIYYGQIGQQSQKCSKKIRLPQKSERIK